MKDGRLKFCVFRKYKGTVCVYGNKPRNITQKDCIECTVPFELTQEKRKKDRRLIPDRRKEKRSIDRRKGDRRKLDI